MANILLTKEEIERIEALTIEEKLNAVDESINRLIELHNQRLKLFTKIEKMSKGRELNA